MMHHKSERIERRERRRGCNKACNVKNESKHRWPWRERLETPTRGRTPREMLHEEEEEALLFFFFFFFSK